MNELHVISENDELSLRNGSAILRVALELQKSAKQSGRSSTIAGGVGKLKDLPGAIELLISRRNTGSFSVFFGLIDKIAKYGLGISIASSGFADSDIGEISHVFCHNQPWLGPSVRKRFPSSGTHLYIHNRVMLGASSFSIRRALAQFDSIVCVSDFIRVDLMRRANVGPSSSLGLKFSTVFNGVDSDIYDRPVPDDIERVDIVFVGRIIPQKGADVLAGALGSIDSGISRKVRVVGGAGFLPSSSLSEYELEVLGVLENSAVSFQMTGPVPPGQIPDLINSAKIIVIPSVWDEPCALVFLEGLASGAAVIASRVGGLPEVGPEAGAVFVDPGESGALAFALNELLLDSDRREKLVAEGRFWARNRPWTKVYSELMDSVC